MSPPWASLPLLPLRCVLEHLSTEDALAATAVCHHWRMAILLYEGHRHTLRLDASDLEQATFLSRLFRRHVRRLHILMDCTEQQLEKLFTYVLPQFFDTVKLEEVLFIGPSYVHQNYSTQYVKLKRIITESFLFKHIHTLKTIGLMGCKVDTVKNDNDRYIHEHIEYHSRPLSFDALPSPGDTLLSRANTHRIAFSNVQHIILDYEQASTEALETLSHLNRLKHLGLNVGLGVNQTLAPIDWARLRHCYPNGLDVAVHIIALPQKSFDDVIENVLVEDLPLTAIKVMFCKTLYVPLISHIVSLYKATLQEFVWSDAPYQRSDEATEGYSRIIGPYSQTEYDTHNINPFMLLCWQCDKLRRLVIHGYWIWQYDVVGYVRLRNSLEELDISAIYSRQSRFSVTEPDCMVRVLDGDLVRTIDKSCVQMVNKLTEFRWAPPPWSKLPAGLRHRPTPRQRADYVLAEITRYKNADE